jgi:succinate dehydrogenase hydrophobic anchor subunit
METESLSPHEKRLAAAERTTRRFSGRAFVSVTTGLSFVAMSVTGVVLFVMPPGRIAYWTGWKMLALTKDQWDGLHIWFSLLFVVAALLHLYLNWRTLVSYFRSKVRKAFALRSEWALALLLCGVVGWGTLARVGPFSSLLTWDRALKDSWDTSAAQAPMPHAELMTLSELAQKTQGLETESMIQNLRAAGVEVQSRDVVLGDLAQNAGMTPRQLYALATGQSRAPRPGGGRGAGRQGQQGGYGIGRLTLRQYCQQQNLDLEKAVQKLREKGFQPAPDATLRDIAVSGGVHPSAMRDILAE